MRTRWRLLAAGALALALSGSASAISIPSTTTQTCSDKIQNETLLFVNALQKQVRLSIKNNIKQVDSKCSGGFACAGGTNHNGTCSPASGNAGCPGGQCTVKTTAGIADKIADAKARLRNKIDQFCSAADLMTLFGTDGTTRCPDPDSVDNGLDEDELADCLLQAAIGDISTAVFGDPASEILARGAAEIVPDGPKVPREVCGVTFASVLSIGSENSQSTIAEAGGPAPLNIENPCIGGVCDTNGQGVIGNNLTAPTQTFAGLIPICLVTVTGDSGNGTSEDGSIDLNTGEQHSFSPISSTVLIGTSCPICDAIVGVCDSGSNAGLPCNSRGSTDVACPPTVIGSPPVIPNPLDLSTEPHTLSVPANNPGGGATNPAGTFCGACDLDDTIGCQNDADCIANGACSGGIGSSCCVFGTNTGAFGVDSATSAQANGVRSQYVPKLGTIFCTGKSGSALVDSTQGLPGPVRLIQQQLNAYKFVNP